MKKWIVAGMFYVSIVAVYAQNITVKGVETNEDTDFSEYKTFSWASQVDSELDEGLYFLNDLVLKADIRDAVAGELKGLGYTMQRNSPDLIVNFRVFEEPVTLSGFQGDAYGSNYWSPNEFPGTASGSSANTGEEEYEVEAGTLIISLLDREDGSLVWQGFASGLIDNNTFIKDENKIREAVNLIFEEYGHRATEYTKK